MGVVPVVESGARKDHGVFIGPFGGVAPAGPGTVPVVAPRWITNDTLRKALPYNKGKIHLWAHKVKKDASGKKRRRGQWEMKSMKQSEESKTRRRKDGENEEEEKEERFGEWEECKVMLRAYSN